ncbi:MAG: hypothetical protein R2762_23910 [Bryobacteraceae bacterium]
MLRKLLAVAAGIVAAVITVGIVEGIGHALFPPPPGIDISDPEALRRLMASIPAGAKAFVVLAWALGSFLGGWVAAHIASNVKVGAAIMVGMFMLAAGMYTIFSIPHPVWMAGLGLLLPLPMAWLGARVRMQA